MHREDLRRDNSSGWLILRERFMFRELSRHYGDTRANTFLPPTLGGVIGDI